jgi:hypothetical protein
MSRYSVSPDLLFDRPWRAGHPFRPHTGRMRRRCIALLLLVLCLIIGGYGYLTDSARVRAMAQSYLSGLIGGRVEVGSARLSIFEGLRLEDVTVDVDEEGGAPDTVLLHAQTIVVLYDPRAMLAGRLEATQIIAEKPRVMMTVDSASNSWNYARLARLKARRRRPVVPNPTVPNLLPEILLRNARLSMSELQGGKLVERGSMAIDGQLVPSADGQGYSFELQSRGTEGIGPYVSGSVNSLTGGVDAHLRNFEFGQDWDFGHDVQAMLPAAVRQWWQRHQLAGRLDIPVVHYQPGLDGAPSSFRVETDLNGVTLTVGPEEWGENVPLKPPVDSPTAGPPIKAISLRQVAGVLVFTDTGIDVTDVSGRVENNAIRVSGRIDGYGPAAPLKLRVSSLASENIYIPPSPRYVDLLPKPVREFYRNLRPQGACAIDVELERRGEGGPPIVRGSVDIINGQFALKQFPYPLREAVGRVTFGPEGADGSEMVHIVNLRGRGVENGPNRDAFVTIDGSVGPLLPDTDPALDVRVSGVGISSEPTLRDAFPPEVRQALRTVGANGEDYPSYFGDFVCRVHKPAGKKAHWTFDTDIALDDAAGALVGFPYPLHHVRGNLKIRDGYLDVEGAEARRGDATVNIDGRVAWGTTFDEKGNAIPMVTDKPLQTMLRVRIHHLPIDADLLAALPPERRDWLTKIGLKGALDIDGVVSQPPATVMPGSVAATQPATPAENSPDFDLKLALTGGELQPPGSSFVVSGVSGTMRLTPDSIHIDSVSGHRGAGRVGMSGDVSWADSAPQVALRGQAVALQLDQALHDLVPAGARAEWDQLRPVGSIDADISYHTPQPAAATASPQTQPAPQAQFRAVLKPHDLSITPVKLPYRFDRLNGAIAIDGPHLVVPGLTARHGDATFALAGTGELNPRGSYDLQLSAKNVNIDPALRDALPASLQNIIDGLKLHGPCDFRFTRLAYRPGATTRPAEPDAASAAQDAEQLDLSLAVTFKGGGLDVGVPLDHVNGQIKLDAELRDQSLTSIRGDIDIDSLSMAGRVLHNFSADLVRTPDGDGLQLTKMQADLAGGQMAGEVNISFPADGPSRYALNLVVSNADVRQLAQETDPSIQGDLTASLTLEGAWGDPSSRRGRGDVLVVGKEMYRLPLILGLLQVTNLALPIAQPFHRGTARYSLDGQRVNFEQIELRSDTMLMDGTGHLDFGTKQVRMSFVTDNPSALQVPFLKDLLTGARNELFKINVKGTITQPKVETSVMGTFTTTVDEVFRGDEGKEGK